MTTNNASIETLYADILAPGDDPDLRRIVGILDRDLTSAFVAESPPSVRLAIERLVDEHRQGLRPEPNSIQRSVPGRVVAWWRRLWTTRRAATIAVVAMVTLISAGCIGYASSQVIHVFPPEQQMPPGVANDVTGLPAMPPLPFIRYRAIDPARAAQQSGLPVAYLSRIPSDLRGTLGTAVYDQGPWPPTDRHAVLMQDSLVRYRGKGHALIIELSEPSPAVIAKYRVLLGNHTVRLPNGQPAWTSVSIQSFQPNVVSFVAGQYIVSVASNLSLARTEQLASTVTVSPETADATRRGIPSTWPTPLPADTAVPGVEIAMVGTADHYVSSNGKPGLQYDLQIGNRGMGQEQNEDVTLLLPPGITFANHTPGNRYIIHFGGGNGGMGGTEDLMVTDQNAFDQGLTVRVTWTEHGAAGVRTFHFPITSGPAPTPFPVSPNSSTR